MSLSKIKGFSLVEIIILLVILGLVLISILSPIKKLTRAAHLASLQGTQTSIQSAVALAILKYQAKGDKSAVLVPMGSKAIYVNKETGVPIGAYPGIGNALGFPSEKSSNGLVVDYTLPLAVTFQLHNKNQDCEIIYNGIAGGTIIATQGC